MQPASTNLENAARQVLDRLETQVARQFDPSLITLVAELLLAVLERCRESRNPAEIEAAAKTRPLLAKVRVRRELRAMLSRGEWRRYGRELSAAAAEAASAATPGEIAALAVDVE